MATTYPWTSGAPHSPLVPGGLDWNWAYGFSSSSATVANVPAGYVTLHMELQNDFTVSGSAYPYFGISFPYPTLGMGTAPSSVAGPLVKTANAWDSVTWRFNAFTSGTTASFTFLHPGGEFSMQLSAGSGNRSHCFVGDPVWETFCPPGPPTITKLIPTAGPDTGGTLVDIIGTNLTGATAVDFGGTAGIGLTVDPSGNLATVTSPAHTAGPAPVTITTPAGTSNAETFTFEAPLPPGLPTLTGIDPTEGPETGGTTALLTGTNLTGTTGVDFGGTPATIITTTTTAILVTTPPHPAGTVNVTATDGTTTTDPLSFEYVPVVEPTYGPDVIANLVALLAAELGVPVSSRRSPTATKDSDPSVVVRRTGGPSKGVASDNPTVTIEAWAPTTTESFQLLQSARLVVIEAAEQGRAGLRRYEEFAGPADLPDPSTTNPRHTLTASVVTRLE